LTRLLANLTILAAVGVQWWGAKCSGAVSVCSSKKVHKNGAE